MKNHSFYQYYLDFIKDHNFAHNDIQANIAKEFDNFLPTISMSTSFDKPNLLDKLFAKKKKQTDIMGIYLYADVGRGKSFMMDLFYECLPIKDKMRIHFHHFMKDLHSKLFEYRQKNLDNPIDIIADEIAKKTKIICFDELQILDITDATAIGRIFNALLKRNIRFIITSNRSPDDLYKNGLNRELSIPFIGILKKHLHVITLDHGTDYRKNRLENMDIYIYPLGIKSKNHLDKIWNILTDYAVPEILSIDYLGRKILIPHYYNNITRISFNDLCDAVLAAGDYAEMMNYIDIFILENIPLMTSDMRNQATRFRNFIDVTYEHKKIIYFSSEVSPDNLYSSGDFSFEFARTISRIEEMRAKNYLTNR